jgi:hypothetical protein
MKPHRGIREAKDHLVPGDLHMLWLRVYYTLQPTNYSLNSHHPTNGTPPQPTTATSRSTLW